MYGGKGTIIGGAFRNSFYDSVYGTPCRLLISVSGYQIVVTGFVLILSVLIDTIRAKKLNA